MVRVTVLAILLGVAVLTPAAADKERVSGWLVESRAKVVETATTARLAMLCQRLSIRMDRSTFEDVMTRRIGVTAPSDRAYATAAISEGDALALSDFKYAAATACMNLTAGEVSAAADILTGRTTLRIMDHTR